jgi:hypothetical protein
VEKTLKKISANGQEQRTQRPKETRGRLVPNAPPVNLAILTAERDGGGAGRGPGRAVLRLASGAARAPAGPGWRGHVLHGGLTPPRLGVEPHQLAHERRDADLDREPKRLELFPPQRMVVCPGTSGEYAGDLLRLGRLHVPLQEPLHEALYLPEGLAAHVGQDQGAIVGVLRLFRSGD